MIEIETAENISATIECPASKSYTNRALIIAALADGEVRLGNPLFSTDTHHMQNALRKYGVNVVQEEKALAVNGTGGILKVPGEEIFIGNAGTTMRFLTTFSALAPGISHITGDSRMQERPLEDLLVCLRSMGVNAHSVKNNSCPPVEVHGGDVPGGTVQLAGNKSSQYLTSVMMCAPYFKNDTTIEIIGDLTSKSYIDITVDIMNTFGVTVENESYEKFHIPSGVKYQPQTYAVEGDASSASYFFGAAAVTGGEVAMTNLNPDSVQGDFKFLDVLEQMGCTVKKSPEKISVKGNPLRGISINMNNMPDVVQTLGVIALFAEGETSITGIGNLRIKETDRIAALSTELTLLGAEVEAGVDYIKIRPGSYKGCEIDAYDDHRMPMSFAIAGLRIPGVKLKNPECVDKSFPDFFNQFNKLYERT